MWTICKHVIKNEVLISPGHTVRAVSHVRLMLGKCKSFRRDRAQGGKGARRRWPGDATHQAALPSPPHPHHSFIMILFN